MTTSSEHVQAAQDLANKEHVSNTLLYAVAYKTGRIPQTTLLDFAKLSTMTYRDQIVCAAFCSCIGMLQEELDLSHPEAKQVCAALLQATQEHMNASYNQFKHLYDYVREEHQEELKNELNRYEQQLRAAEKK